jgi:SAM-dependent methyltransferase
VDHFHLGGLDATLELLRLADIERGLEVLDVGGGLGGAARILATRTGANVTVLDATEEYCRVGQRLTTMVGLDGRVKFHHGDGSASPFADAAFDVVWMQHTNMNIEDKGALFAEMHRVLRPNGRVAFHEVMAGPNGPVRFPVPWADHQSISFLRPAEEMRDLVSTTGLKEVLWIDVTDSALDYWKARLAASPEGPPTLSTHLLMGSEARSKSRNVLRNLEESRMAVVQAVFERP